MNVYKSSIDKLLEMVLFIISSASLLRPILSIASTLIREISKSPSSEKASIFDKASS